MLIVSPNAASGALSIARRDLPELDQTFVACRSQDYADCGSTRSHSVVSLILSTTR
jgi:hypothetical protein